MVEVEGHALKDTQSAAPWARFLGTLPWKRPLVERLGSEGRDA